MNWMDSLFHELQTIPEVAGLAAADDTGTYIAGMNIDDTDEFAALLTFIGRSGLALEEHLGLDPLVYTSLSGKKIKLIVHRILDYFVGIRLSEKSSISKVEGRINSIVGNLDIEDE